MQNWQLWRNLHTGCAVAVALLLYRTTALGILGAISVGLALATMVVCAGYALSHRRDRSDREN